MGMPAAFNFMGRSGKLVLPCFPYQAFLSLLVQTNGEALLGFLSCDFLMVQGTKISAQ